MDRNKLNYQHYTLKTLDFLFLWDGVDFLPILSAIPPDSVSNRTKSQHPYLKTQKL